MANSNAFSVFKGSSLSIRWAFYAPGGASVEATGLTCSVYSNQRIFLFNTTIIREEVGFYYTVVDTVEHSMNEGTYILELTAIALSQNIAQRDTIVVKYLT